MALTKVIGAGVGSLTEDLALSDSDKIKLGAGSDLQLYHDGSHSYIDEVGTGSLYVRASIIRWTNADGSETLGGVDADGGWFLKANNSNALVIDTNGHVTKPLQPAFHARPASNRLNMGTGASIDMLFGTEVYDQNLDFDGQNGYVFTAPVTGKYLFTCMLVMFAVDKDYDYIETRIATSNRNYQNFIDPGTFAGDANYWTQTVTAVTDMDANDTCKIIFASTGGAEQLDISSMSTFSGALIC